MACVFLGARLFRPLGSIRLRGYGYFARWAQYASAAAAISPVGLNTPPRCAPPPAPAPRGGDGRKLRLDGAESKPHGAGYIKLRLGGAESKPHVIRVNRCVIRANRRVMRANREKTINTEN